MQRTLEKTEKNISSDSTLVGLIQHNNGITTTKWVDQTFTLEHTIRHVFDPCFRASAVLETDCISNFLSHPTTHLL